MERGEGSSRVGKSRARGVVEEQHAHVITRTVQYMAPYVVQRPNDQPIPEDEKVFSRHTFLKIALDTDERVKCEKFVDIDLLKHRTINLNLMDQLGATQQVRQFLGPKWLNAITFSSTQS